MIKRVRIKFTLIGMAAAAAVTLALILAINLVNAYQVNRHLDNALLEMSQAMTPMDGAGREEDAGNHALKNDSSESLSSENNSFGGDAYGRESGTSWGEGLEQAEKKKHKKLNRLSASVKYAGRSYAVFLHEDGEMHYIGAGEEELSEEHGALVDQIVSGGNARGTVDDYRYLVQQEEGGTRVFFLDIVTERQEQTSLLWISAAVGIGGILLCLVFIYLMSGKIVQPLKESMEKQKRFITDASHELKTPLSVIGTNMDILSMDLGENEWIDSTKKQVKRLRRLVASLVSLARMDEEESVLPSVPFSVSNAVTESAEPFVGMAQLEGKEMVLDVRENLTVVGDEASIRQLFTILCDNAVKYAAAGRPILVRLYQGGKKICFETANAWDREQAPEKLDTLFDRFYRADPSRDRRRNQSSYGLGLSIAQGIARKNHVRLTVSEDAEHRLVFRCEFGAANRV